jgi:hypothetical protein
LPRSAAFISVPVVRAVPLNFRVPLPGIEVILILDKVSFSMSEKAAVKSLATKVIS